jgi:hypothetical protein
MFNTKSFEFRLALLILPIKFLLDNIIVLPKLYANNFCLLLIAIAIFIGLRREFSAKTTAISMSLAIVFIVGMYYFLIG